MPRAQRLIAAAAHAGEPRQARIRMEDLPKGSVRLPGEKGYNGPRGNKPESQQAWDEHLKTRGTRPRVRDAFNDVPGGEALSGDRTTRTIGRISYGMGGTLVAAGGAGGVLAYRQGHKNARTIRATPLDQKVKYGRQRVKVGKALPGVKGMPFVREARSRGGVHTVHNIPSTADKIREVPGRVRDAGERLRNKERRFAHFAGHHPDAGELVISAGLIGGAALAGTGASLGGRPMKQAQAERRKAQLAAKKQGKLVRVGKRFTPAHVKNALRHPAELRRVIRENPWEAGIAAGGLAAGGAAAGADRRHRTRTGVATAAGAAAGQGAYYTAGFGALARAETLKRKGQKEGHNGLSRSAQEAIWRKHRKAHGHTQGQPMSVKTQRDLFTNYPDKLPGWKHQRFAAHLQRGKYGKLINAGVTAGGAAALGGGSAVASHREIRKALYQREERVSPIRALELATGGTLATYGFAHSGMVGAGLGRGIKFAERNGNETVAEAIRRAEAARGSIRAGMAPGEAAIRRIKAVDSAIRKVPRPIRAEVALAAGVLLGSRAIPVRRTHYTAVSAPVPSYGPRW